MAAVRPAEPDPKMMTFRTSLTLPPLSPCLGKGRSSRPPAPRGLARALQPRPLRTNDGALGILPAPPRDAVDLQEVRSAPGDDGNGAHHQEDVPRSCETPAHQFGGEEPDHRLRGPSKWQDERMHPPAEAEPAGHALLLGAGQDGHRQPPLGEEPGRPPCGGEDHDERNAEIFDEGLGRCAEGRKGPSVPGPRTGRPGEAPSSTARAMRSIVS